MAERIYPVQSWNMLGFQKRENISSSGQETLRAIEAHTLRTKKFSMRQELRKKVLGWANQFFQERKTNLFY